MRFQFYPQPIEVTNLFAINDSCMEYLVSLLVVIDSHRIVVDTLHFFIFYICHYLPTV